MLGQTIEARSAISKGAIVCAAIATVLVLWAVLANNPHPAIAAVLPAIFAVGLWLGRPPTAIVTLEHNGISPLGSNCTIPYNSIRAVTAGGARYRIDAQTLPDKPIEIHHDEATLIIPPRMNVSPIEFYRFLVQQVPQPEERPIVAELADFANEQRNKFGTEKVEVIRVREILAETWRRRWNRAIAISILLVGLAWLGLGMAFASIVGHADEYAVWIVFGSLSIVGAGLAGFALRSASAAGTHQLVAKHPDACIVISPAGFAMSQGDLQGILRWDQIRSANTKIPQLLRTRKISGLRLMIHGGEIIALDIYDRSPRELEQLIRRNLGLTTALESN